LRMPFAAIADHLLISGLVLPNKENIWESRQRLMSYLL
jgi:hypothetical protein